MRGSGSRAGSSTPLLGLERLVQAVGIAPPLHHAPGELVDDDDLVVLDDVVGVAAEQLVRAQRLIDVVHDQRRWRCRNRDPGCFEQAAVSSQVSILDALDAFHRSA